MAATFYERAMRIGDYENDGGMVEVESLQNCLILFEKGDYTAAQIKSYFSCTSAQEEDVDDLVATMPGLVLTVLNAVARATWALRIGAIFRGSLMGLTGFTTETDVKTALGV